MIIIPLYLDCIVELNLAFHCTTESRNATNDSTHKPIFAIIGFTLGVFGNVLALIVLVKSAKNIREK
jgi:hypothetical protein